MTPQAAWEFTKQLSPLPGPGGAPSELEQAAQGKYADMGLPEIYPVAQIKENQQIGVKGEAAKAKRAAEQQAQEQGLPHPPQAPILEQLLAQERQRKGEPPMPQMQMSPMPEVPTPPSVGGGMPQQGIPGQAYGGLVGLQDGGMTDDTTRALMEFAERGGLTHRDKGAPTDIRRIGPRNRRWNDEISRLTLQRLLGREVPEELIGAVSEVQQEFPTRRFLPDEWEGLQDAGRQQEQKRSGIIGLEGPIDWSARRSGGVVGLRGGGQVRMVYSMVN